MTTTETDADAYTFTDEIGGKIMMDGNTFLEGGAKLDVTVGGDAPEAVGAETTDRPLSQALGTGRSNPEPENLPAAG